MLPIHCVKITQPLLAKTRNGLAQIRRPTATKIRNPERTQILGVSAEKLGAVQLHSEERRSVPLLNIPISVTTKSFCNRSPQGTTWENVSKVET